MTRGVAGPDGTDWHPGTEHEASEEYAAYLERMGKGYVISPVTPSDRRAGVVASSDVPTVTMGRKHRGK
jgi:DNA-binding LacI/PurR family transcriptional regulator